ncbi:MAG: M20/M25/M40 family metallo-hydrolase [Planctomycetes bacterium]|nr:M20/M25/M40 family metallo-hydrolase [Planctomycetota bacterium]
MNLKLVPTALFLTSLLAAQAAVLTSPVANPLPDAVADAIAKEGIDNSQVMRLLRDVCGKVGHRLTGSDNFTKACEWAKAEFEAMGLEVELEKWGEWKLAWNRGAWIGRVTKPVAMDMYVATDAWTAGTKGLQQGAVVAAPKADDEAAVKATAGKWTISKGKPSAAVRKAIADAGALGCVYRAGDPNKNFPTRVRVFGNQQTAMKALAEAPTFPEIAVQADHFDALLAMVEEGKDVACEFDIQNSFREGPIELNNVIATLKGSAKPDEVVIVSSHLDSWHQKQGTTDNGTGSTTTMEAARILTKVGVKPLRTIKFCLWGGEEQGLLGSRGYVQRHRADMTKVSAVFNHDTGTNWAQSIGVSQAMADQLAPLLAQANRVLKAPDADWNKPVFEFNVQQRVAGGGGSDHASFIAAGVPGLNWNLKGRSNYFEHTWHTQWDTIEVAIEEYQRHTATLIAMAALTTANLPAMLDRTAVSTGGGGGNQSAAFASAWFEAEMEEFTFKSVKEGGRAAKMGVQKGDVLKKIGGQELERLRQIFQFARETEGDAVTFTFQRGDKTFDAKMKKEDLPQNQRPGEGRGGRGGDNAPRDTVPPAGGGQGAAGQRSGGGD